MFKSHNAQYVIVCHPILKVRNRCAETKMSVRHWDGLWSGREPTVPDTQLAHSRPKAGTERGIAQ
ncbi:hypothetical protein GCM10009828_028110 [Actinoplanes couchii]|uniref:Uncharacterized protein n=1 Tax=Actinoplanes couchii TaxID=403638 RepID=A0ABQ3XCV7_9ACTN|nr:hypothetical protein Aco03nite_046240 [Actinoplanes couchii]